MTIIRWRSRPDLEKSFGPYYENEFGYRAHNTELPATNIKKSGDRYEINMAVPGLKKDDFQIHLENNILSISYNPKEEGKEKDNNHKYLRREFAPESFKRQFTLPETTHTDNISARYENGILQVFVPFEDPEKAKVMKSITVN